MAMATATVNQLRVSTDASDSASSSGGNANSTFATPRIDAVGRAPGRSPATTPGGGADDGGDGRPRRPR